MDSRPYYRNKAMFSSFTGVVWTEPQCLKTKTKVISLTSDRKQKQFNEPLLIQGEYM